MELSHKEIQAIRSINLVSITNPRDTEKLKFEPIINRTSSFKFTVPSLEGRSQKKLVVSLRTKSDDLFNEGQLSTTLLKLLYHERKNDKLYRELEIFTDFFKPVDYGYNFSKGNKTYALYIFAIASLLVLALLIYFIRLLIKRCQKNSSQGRYQEQRNSFNREEYMKANTYSSSNTTTITSTRKASEPSSESIVIEVQGSPQ